MECLKAILGPLLFDLYTNDLDSGLRSNTCKFADAKKKEKKNWSEINSEEDSKILQDELDKVLKMSRDRQIV